MPSSILNPQSSSRSFAILSIITLLLAGASLWHPERGMEFQYRGQPRWTGPWDNPNLFGVLMGVGFTLALGLIVSRLMSNGQSREAKVGSRFVAQVTRHTSQLLLLGAVGLCGYGLIKSYSRGAWVGTAVGLAFLLFQVVKFQVSSGGAGRVVALLRRNWFPSSILLFSILVLSFWQFRHTESPLARRLFSVGNPNDFSWRNRVTAWQGAGRMMLHKPLAGFGWGKAEEIYSKEYRAARLEESAAIQMNDFFMLGISAGTPALFCLLVYFSLCCRRSRVESREPDGATPHPSPLPERGGEGGGLQISDLRLQTSATVPASATRHSSPPTICFAGAIVLLIGFWFDGGLFKLPTAVVFWVLIELCRRRGDEAQNDGRACHSVRAGLGQTDDDVHGATRPTLALRWVAGLVALAALALTAVHLGTPQLVVSERSLAVARNFLVPPRERNDFEFLAAKNIWSGQPLKVLLQHAHLANYNRSLVNWKLDDELYREFVLSSVIDGTPSTASASFRPASQRAETVLGAPPSTDLNWRRPLWEYFYPRIRKESSPDAAAEIIVRNLNEVCRRRGNETNTVATTNSTPHVVAYKSITEIWREQTASNAEFERISVAALRAAGIPARLAASSQAEFWNGAEWKPSPRSPELQAK